MVTTNELLLRASEVCVDDEFLQHYGKKGMKWGQRQTAKAQGRIDRTHRLATGTGSTRDKLLRGQLTKKGSAKALQRGANAQARIAAGKGLLTKKGRAKVAELNFHVPGSAAKAKLDRGQKAALAIGVGMTLASIAGSR